MELQKRHETLSPLKKEALIQLSIRMKKRFDEARDTNNAFVMSFLVLQTYIELQLEITAIHAAPSYRNYYCGCKDFRPYIK